MTRTHTHTHALIAVHAIRAPQSNYAGLPCPGSLHSVSDALAAYGNVTYAPGCSISGLVMTSFADAIAAAASSDVTVLVMGNDLTVEAEGLDRVSIGWPGVQQNLISAVANAAIGPVILVVMAGGSIDISAQLGSANVGAIIWAG